MRRAEHFDVVVVGSGAGAAALVTGLLRGTAARSLRVCMLERGPDLEPPNTPAESNAGLGIARREDAPAPLVDETGHPSAQFSLEGSGLGGGTVIYTGNVLRFMPEDFRRRERLGSVEGAQLADWPITYDELAPYYDEMEAEIGVGGDAVANPFEPPRRGPYPAPAVAFDRAGELGFAAAHRLGWHPFPIPTVASPSFGRLPCTKCGLCTAFPCTARARWSARAPLLAAAATGQLELRLHATACRVLTSADGEQALGVEYIDEAGALQAVHGSTIVLAANAIQTPRLLLQSASNRHPDGLGNDSGQVGRNLMTHVVDPLLSIGHIPGESTIDAAGCTLAIQDFYDASRSGVPLHFTLQPRAMGSFGVFSRLLAQARAEPGAAKADGEPATLRERHRGHLTVPAMVEDLPRATNRVRLHPELRDRLGMPIPMIDYTAHELDLQTAQFAAKKARELLDAAGAREVVTVSSPNARFHLMGTCRMGADPRSSVVDRDGRSHHVRNLYVADGSLFVTSAGVNPCLTVQALARRIAHRMVAAR